MSENSFICSHFGIVKVFFDCFFQNLPSVSLLKVFEKNNR